MPVPSITEGVKLFKRVAQGVAAGGVAGAAAALFLHLLHFATVLRQENGWLIYFLPFGGLLIGWGYTRFGKGSEKGNNLVIDSIHNPDLGVPLRMAPMVLAGTVLTHLLGGSAGREGTAVQMGATLSAQISRAFRLGVEERRAMLVAGAGAGFGAAIGAPWAGVIFGMEMIQVGRFRLVALVECLIASHVAYSLTLLMGAPHTVYATIVHPELDVRLLGSSLAAGAIFGIAAVCFIKSTHRVAGFISRWVRFAPLRPLIGGVLLVCLYQVEGSDRYAGLGLETIQEALTIPASFYEPLFKGIFTAITLGSGFKGGEFIPLVFIGTTLGSALSGFLSGGAPFLGALGFAAVFGAAANTPLACTIMAMEIFGPSIGIPAAIACYTAFYFTGSHTIYSSQKMHRAKFERLRNRIMPANRID